MFRKSCALTFPNLIEIIHRYGASAAATSTSTHRAGCRCYQSCRRKQWQQATGIISGAYPDGSDYKLHRQQWYGQHKSKTEHECHWGDRRCGGRYPEEFKRQHHERVRRRGGCIAEVHAGLQASRVLSQRCLSPRVFALLSTTQPAAHPF